MGSGNVAYALGNLLLKGVLLGPFFKGMEAPISHTVTYHSLWVDYGEWAQGYTSAKCPCLSVLMTESQKAAEQYRKEKCGFYVLFLQLSTVGFLSDRLFSCHFFFFFVIKSFLGRCQKVTSRLLIVTKQQQQQQQQQTALASSPCKLTAFSHLCCHLEKAKCLAAYQLLLQECLLGHNLLFRALGHQGQSTAV